MRKLGEQQKKLRGPATSCTRVQEEAKCAVTAMCGSPANMPPTASTLVAECSEVKAEAKKAMGACCMSGGVVVEQRWSSAGPCRVTSGKRKVAAHSFLPRCSALERALQRQTAVHRHAPLCSQQTDCFYLRMSELALVGVCVCVGAFSLNVSRRKCSHSSVASLLHLPLTRCKICARPTQK